MTFVSLMKFKCTLKTYRSNVDGQSTLTIYIVSSKLFVYFQPYSSSKLKKKVIIYSRNSTLEEKDHELALCVSDINQVNYILQSGQLVDVHHVRY